MRVWPILILLPLLAGCSGIDWDSLTSFGTSSGDEAATATPATPAQVAATAPAPAQAAPQASQFCSAVAKEDAMGGGFDTTTQQRVALRSYQQCVQIFGNTTER